MERTARSTLGSSPQTSWRKGSRSASGPEVPGNAGLRVEHHKVDLEDPLLSKIERQILDRAGVGMKVSRLLDTIQEPDALIETAIVDLIERGAVRLEAAA